MTILQSLFLGCLQGLSEFLPISSSGHLVVFRNFMALGEIPILFDILLHAATLLVVIIVFRSTIWELILSFVRFLTKKANDEDKNNLKLILVLLIATAVTAVLGFAIESLNIASKPWIVSIMFIITAVVLILTKFINKEDTGYSKIGIKTAIITGVAQGIAVFPGISRSGMTVTAALFSGVGRKKAGEYSLLLSIPAILGAIILEFKDFDKLGTSVSTACILVGMAAAFVVGLFSAVILLNIIKKDRLYLFSFYLIPFAIVSFILLKF